MFFVVAVALAVAEPPPLARAPARERVFFGDISAGEGASKGEASLLGDAVLASARRHADALDIIGTKDLTNILDVEANKQAVGCTSDSVACASEIADALNAPKLVTGTLGRVGNTWVLTLSMLVRATMQVAGRSQVNAEGEHPDVLLPKVDRAVDEMLGVDTGAEASASVSVPDLALVGGAAGAVGLLTLAGAAGCWLVANNELNEGVKARDALDAEAMKQHHDLGLGFYTASIVSAIAGGVLVVGGAGLVALGFLAGDGE